MICVKTIKNHVSDIISSIAVNDDVIVTGSRGNTVKIWSLRDGSLIRTLKYHPDLVYRVAINNDIIVTRSDTTIIVLSIKDGEVIRTLEDVVDNNNIITSIAFNNDVIISGFLNGLIKVWKDWTLIKTLKEHIACISSLVLNDDILVSGSGDYTIKIWKDWTLIRTLENKSFVNCICLNNDLIISGSVDNTIKIWKDGSLIKTLEGHTSSVVSLSVNNDTIISGSFDKTIKIWSLKSGRLLETFGSWRVPNVVQNGEYIITEADDIKIWSTYLNYYKKLRKVLSKKPNVISDLPEDIIYLLSTF